MIETIVTIPPLVVRIRASSTVFVKASSLVNRDLGGMVGGWLGQRPKARTGQVNSSKPMECRAKAGFCRDKSQVREDKKEKQEQVGHRAKK